MREALAEIRDSRPFFDSEHGPIHSFKDHGRTLPEPFDDEYFRHIQWAHLASGGAGGGMRWPNRHPHVLTAGMRRAQGALAGFLPLIDWPRFRRRPLAGEARVADPAIQLFACGDGHQAVLHLLRADRIMPDGMLDPAADPIATTVASPTWSPASIASPAGTPSRAGRAPRRTCPTRAARSRFPTAAFANDLALAVTRV